MYLEVNGRHVIHPGLQNFLCLLQQLDCGRASFVSIGQVFSKLLILFLQLLKLLTQTCTPIIIIFLCLLLLTFSCLVCLGVALFIGRTSHCPNATLLLRVEHGVVWRLHRSSVLPNRNNDSSLQHCHGKLDMGQPSTGLSNVGHLLAQDIAHFPVLLPDASDAFLGFFALAVLLHCSLRCLLFRAAQLAGQLVHLLLTSGQHPLGSLQLPCELFLCLPQLLSTLSLRQLLLALVVLACSLEVFQSGRHSWVNLGRTGATAGAGTSGGGRPHGVPCELDSR
mmetsp:Transcript_5999/g.14103  ORF Transcript_5999/g.14103 Transcript_5999/m.14103 type:complete len:280 (-) Transcript_5999:36-875(-)